VGALLRKPTISNSLRLSAYAGRLFAWIADLIIAILIATVLAVAGSVGILAIVLRRHGVALVQWPPASAQAPATVRITKAAQAISAPKPLVIEAPAPRSRRSEAVSAPQAAAPLGSSALTGWNRISELQAPASRGPSPSAGRDSA
jgi:hypothetical protein